MFHYIARAVGIANVLFISSFALDVFRGSYWEPVDWIGLSIHLIPAVVLLLLLIIAWNYERIGGVLFLIVSIVTFILLSNEWWVNLLLALPSVAAGLLFILSSTNHRGLRRKINH